MEGIQKITLKSSDDQIIECNAKLLKFSVTLSNAPNIQEEIPCIHEAQLLKKIISFYEMYNFDENEFKTEEFTKKITSTKLKDNLTEKCLEYLKEWVIDETEVDIEKMKEIVFASYQYNLIDLKTVLLKAIGTKFYCGAIDIEIDAYEKKHNLSDVMKISPEEQLRLMTIDYKGAFDKLNERLSNELSKQKPKLEEGN